MTSGGRYLDVGDDLVIGGMLSCPTCGKVRYTTRKVARRARRRLGDRSLSAYRCGRYWHLGHLPPQVVHGEITRDQIPRSGRRRPYHQWRTW